MILKYLVLLADSLSWGPFSSIVLWQYYQIVKATASILIVVHVLVREVFQVLIPAKGVAATNIQDIAGSGVLKMPVLDVPDAFFNTGEVAYSDTGYSDIV